MDRASRKLIGQYLVHKSRTDWVIFLEQASTLGDFTNAFQLKDKTNRISMSHLENQELC